MNYPCGNQYGRQGRPIQGQSGAVQCPRIQSALTETIMLDPKAQVKGHLATVNMIAIMMNDSKWLSALGC